MPHSDSPRRQPTQPNRPERPASMQFVRPVREETAKQEIPTVLGINSETTSARGISMSLTMFEPGGHSNCHMHVGSESALYVLHGSAHFFFGDRLEQDQIANQGDFVYVPPSCPHKGYNRSRTDRAVFVVARTDALEQERVIEAPGADDGSAAMRVVYMN